MSRSGSSMIDKGPEEQGKGQEYNGEVDSEILFLSQNNTLCFISCYRGMEREGERRSEHSLDL